jgi:hypothetical protein
MGKVRGVCKPVYPHEHLKVNTIFEVVQASGKQTAYTDKHPAYDLVRGPSGKGLSVGYFPEIQSYDSESLIVLFLWSCPNSTAVATNVTQIIAYDTYHVKAFLAWIKGQTLPNTEIQEALTAVPTLFGGNFQAVSVAQKTYGYKNGTLAFSGPLVNALTFVDDSLGSVVTALTQAGVYQDTLLFVCSKHGQAPIDPSLYRKIDQKKIGPATGVEVAQITADDIGLIWLANQSDVGTAVANLEKNRTALQIKRIISGDDLVDQGFGNPTTNPDAPDIIIVPELGVIYTTSTAKIAEHGGVSADDTNIACFVSNPSLEQRTYSERVSTRRLAPTILKVLGLDIKALQSVAFEGTDVLPGF